MNEYKHYHITNFNKSYKKYLIQDGYVKYVMTNSLNQKIDTVYYQVYFSEFGSKEYIRSFDKYNTEILKTDSIQYIKRNNNFLDSMTFRQPDFLFEKVVTNESSLLKSSSSCEKPMDVRFNHKICNSCFTTFTQDNKSANYRVTFYKGLPVEIKLYQQGAIIQNLKAIKIDTNAVFPIVLKIK